MDVVFPLFCQGWWMAECVLRDYETLPACPWLWAQPSRPGAGGTPAPQKGRDCPSLDILPGLPSKGLSMSSARAQQGPAREHAGSVCAPGMPAAAACQCGSQNRGTCGEKQTALFSVETQFPVLSADSVSC